MQPLSNRPPASVRRPLRDAIAALGRPPPTARRHGAEFLADLMDFEGAVKLVHVLQGPPPSLLPPRAAGDGVARAAKKLAAAERDARQPVRDGRGGEPLISAERLERVLADAGVPAARRRKAIEAAAHEIFAPVEAAVQRHLGSINPL